MAVNIKRPPIVGVPFFFKWLSGPSSRTVCPTLSFLKKGIIIGPKATLIANDISVGITIS